MKNLISTLSFLTVKKNLNKNLKTNTSVYNQKSVHYRRDLDSLGRILGHQINFDLPLPDFPKPNHINHIIHPNIGMKFIKIHFQSFPKSLIRLISIAIWGMMQTIPYKLKPSIGIVKREIIRLASWTHHQYDRDVNPLKSIALNQNSWYALKNLLSIN